MPPVQRARPLTVAVASAVIAVLLAVVPLTASPAAAQQAPAVVVEPVTELVGGQFVEVTWSGFPAGGAVNVRQCGGERATGLEACTTTLQNGISRGDGSGREYYDITVGELRPGVLCDYLNPCSIGVFPDSRGPEAGASAPIRFAFPQSACPRSSGSPVDGSGASAANRAMNRWLSDVCREPLLLDVGYTLRNSVDGGGDLARGLTDYAVTGLELAEADRTALSAEGTTFEYAPLTASALVFAYNIRDRATQERITDLVLTPELLALLFNGQIRTWADQRITALNPTRQFPPQAKAIARADNSATTFLVTSWFEAVARDAWRAGGQQFTGGATTTFPAGAVTTLSGAAAVAREVARPSRNTDPVAFGHISFMDSSYAALVGLPTVRIRTPAGDVTATPETVAEALRAMRAPAPERLPVPDFAAAGPAVYPLPTVTYLVTPTSGIAAGEARTLRAFLEYATGTGQGAAALPPGYVPLPEELRAASQATAGRIPGTGGAGGGGGGSGGGTGGGTALPPILRVPGSTNPAPAPTTPRPTPTRAPAVPSTDSGTGTGSGTGSGSTFDDDEDFGTDSGTDFGTDFGTDSGTDFGTDFGTDSGTDFGTDFGTDEEAFLPADGTDAALEELPADSGAPVDDLAVVDPLDPPFEQTPEDLLAENGLATAPELAESASAGAREDPLVAPGEALAQGDGTADLLPPAPTSVTLQNTAAWLLLPAIVGVGALSTLSGTLLSSGTGAAGLRTTPGRAAAGLRGLAGRLRRRQS